MANVNLCAFRGNVKIKIANSLSKRELGDGMFWDLFESINSSRKLNKFSNFLNEHFKAASYILEINIFFDILVFELKVAHQHSEHWPCNIGKQVYLPQFQPWISIITPEESLQKFKISTSKFLPSENSELSSTILIMIMIPMDLLRV